MTYSSYLFDRADSHTHMISYDHICIMLIFFLARASQRICPTSCPSSWCWNVLHIFFRVPHLAKCWPLSRMDLLVSVAGAADARAGGCSAWPRVAWPHRGRKLSFFCNIWPNMMWYIYMIIIYLIYNYHVIIKKHHTHQTSSMHDFKTNR